MRAYFVLPVLLAALPLLACGAAVASGPSSDGRPEAGATSFVDAGLLVLQAYGGPAGTVAADVGLSEPGVGQQQTCSSPIDAGACQLTSCRLGGIGSPTPGEGNFGPVSASVGATSISLTYNGFGYGTVDFPSSIALGTGGTMTFRGGDGTTVPSFDVTATVPGAAVLVSPVPTTDGGTATVDASQDLSVTWMPIPIGQFSFGLEGGPTAIGEVQTSLTCTFDGSSGSGVVPSALLSSLKATLGTRTLYSTWGSELDATTVVQGLTIVAQSFQQSPGTLGQFPVTLQ